MNITELQNDKQFMNALADAKTPAEIKALLDAKGIEMSEEDIASAMERSADGELTVDDLEKVSGGVLGYSVIALAFLLGFARGLRCR